MEGCGVRSVYVRGRGLGEEVEFDVCGREVVVALNNDGVLAVGDGDTVGDDLDHCSVYRF